MEKLLQTLNPWWKENTLSQELAKPFKRNIFAEILRVFPYRQITVLTGLRRVGKSTILYQLIEKLLGEGKPDRILYFSFDFKIEAVLPLLQAYENVTGWNWQKEKTVVFFDEIQKLKNWASQLKLLYDSFPHLKFVVSGSSSVALEKEAISTLAGRHFLIGVSPLSFREFLSLTKSRIDLQKQKLWQQEIKQQFQAYLGKPFPELAAWKDEVLIKQYLLESIIDKVVRKDLPDQFRDTREELLMRLLEIFYASPGMYVNYDALASDLKVSKRALLKHVFYLEFAYLIRKVKNYRGNTLTASKKLQRIYPYHWSLLFAMDSSSISESAVASILDVKQYWRDGEKEIDFLLVRKEILPIEVKESSQVKKEDLRHLLYFCEKKKLKRALVVYSGEEKTETLREVKVHYVPFWKLALDEQAFRKE